jgi:hypothetical protein
MRTKVTAIQQNATDFIMRLLKVGGVAKENTLQWIFMVSTSANHIWILTSSACLTLTTRVDVLC